MPSKRAKEPLNQMEIASLKIRKGKQYRGAAAKMIYGAAQMLSHGSYGQRS